MEPTRYSRLKLMARSPAHYRAATIVSTQPMRRGTAVDALLLGTANVVCYPGAVRRGREWELFKADHPEPEFAIVTAKELELATGIADAVRRNSKAMHLLDGQRCSEIKWNYLGRPCVSHPDVVAADRFVTELKTAQTSDPWRFTMQALRLAYHAQLAFYGLAVASSGADKPPAYIVAVESSAPFPVTILRLTDRALDLGERLCRLWMERLLVCEAADRWPEYTDAIVPLDVSEDDEIHLTFAAADAIPAGGSEAVPF